MVPQHCVLPRLSDLAFLVAPVLCHLVCLPGSTRRVQLTSTMGLGFSSDEKTSAHLCALYRVRTQPRRQRTPHALRQPHERRPSRTRAHYTHTRRAARRAQPIAERHRLTPPHSLYRDHTQPRRHTMLHTAHYTHGVELRVKGQTLRAGPNHVQPPKRARRPSPPVRFI